jgi:hypothetical protein
LPSHPLLSVEMLPNFLNFFWPDAGWRRVPDAGWGRVPDVRWGRVLDVRWGWFRLSKANWA